MKEEIIIAGFGGQGVLSMGKILAYSGIMQDQEVTWMPSYGPEMRGGTANCAVIISDKKIASPLVENASVVAVMNGPSLDKFKDSVLPGGDLFINSSIISDRPEIKDVKLHEVDCLALAEEIGNSKVANMVLLGAICEITKAVTKDSIKKVLKKTMTGSKEKLIGVNEMALDAWKA